MRRRILAGIVLSFMAGTTMAASIQVIPNVTSTGQPGTCNEVAGRCVLYLDGSSPFYVIVHGTSLPETVGATLGVSFSGLTMTGAALASTRPSAGRAFDYVVARPTSSTRCSGTDCIILALAPVVGEVPFGTVDAFVLNFMLPQPGTSPNCPEGPPFYLCIFSIDIYDDGGEFSWTDLNANPIPATYTQARINYCPYALDCVIPPVPIPATVWLLGTSLAGLMGWRLRRLAA